MGDNEIILEAILDALTEIEQCPDISQGVEDKLREAARLLGAYDEED